MKCIACIFLEFHGSGNKFWIGYLLLWMNESETVMNTNRRHHNNRHECIITFKTKAQAREKWRKNSHNDLTNTIYVFNPLFSLSNLLKSSDHGWSGKIFIFDGLFCAPFGGKYFLAIHNSKFATKWNLLENFTINITIPISKGLIAHRCGNFNIKFTCFVHVSSEICLKFEQ